jgi:hypothetical protein
MSSSSSLRRSKPGYVVVMDNLAAHTDAGVCEATGAAYDSLMPLPA